MSKGRLSSDERKSRRTSLEGTVESLCFIGISLGGGKADKSSLALLEYFPRHQKLFLSKTFDKIKSEVAVSADAKILEIIEMHQGRIQLVAFDGPWRFPLCSPCKNPCQGYENCPEEHVQWMKKHYETHQKSKKPKKLFTPYTERCVELHLRTELEEPMLLSSALGANTAPLLARASYLQQRIKTPCIEVFPKLSVWRIGRALNIGKTHLRAYRHSAAGHESRRQILTELSENRVAFIYEQDLRLMIDNYAAFEAFVCALTAYLKFTGQTEGRPKGFPKNEDWVEFPTQMISWTP